VLSYRNVFSVAATDRNEVRAFLGKNALSRGSAATRRCFPVEQIDQDLRPHP